jgi:two-component system, NtrC family, sensor kinase
MMKKIILSVILLFCINTIFAQKQHLIDSLKYALTAAKHDTSRILIMDKLSHEYTVIKIDSAFYYSQSALTLSRQIRFAKGEATSLIELGWALRISGNPAKSFEIYLKCLKVANENNLTDIKALALLNIGVIYTDDFKDNAKALNHNFAALALCHSIQDNELAIDCESVIAYIYTNMHQLDLAAHYNQLAFQHSTQFNVNSWMPNILGNFGAIYAAENEFRKAIDYTNQGLRLAYTIENYSLSSRLNIQIAKIYQQENQIDSAVHFAIKALNDAQKGNIYTRIISAGTVLSDLYKKRDQNQMLHYTQIAYIAKDSLYNMGKMFALRSAVEFDEKERQYEIETATASYQNKVKIYSLIAGLGVFLVIAFILYRNSRKQKEANAILQKQKQEIELQKKNVEITLSELKATQSQLIQSEKMASLGELTAGIAHEIQNPLNFVNNFSEVNKELLIEMKDEMKKGNIDEVNTIADDVISNEEKINHHGKRADAIVKGMLQHSRSSTGVKEPTDINKLADEYLRLSYHGLRAKDKEFSAEMKTDFDNTIDKINIIPQDIGRVLLNLYNNAFYAVNEKAKQQPNGYEPTISVSTKKINNKVELTVKDNGNGIPQKVVDKIFQPFFTTKPTGVGTGLGLSLSYDIIKAHGGEIKVETKEGEFTEFVVQLPISV